MTNNLGTAPLPREPYAGLPDLPLFNLTSTDLENGAAAPTTMLSALFGVPGGQDQSPQLSWSGFPEQTQSFVVSCFDPDAPTMSGWWHWTIVDLDASVTSLERGAGASDLQLDGAAFHLAGDSGNHAWFGPYPPDGDGDHRYVFAVHALDVDTLGLDDEASPAKAAFTLAPHCIARATLTATYSVPGEPGAAAFLRDGK